MSKITVYPARKVITMDPGRPVAEAVAVMDGRVLSTGTLASMKPWLSRHEHVIDRALEDKVVLPGLIDPHTHFAMSSGFLALHYIGPIESPGPNGMNPALLTHEAGVFARDFENRSVGGNIGDRVVHALQFGAQSGAQGPAVSVGRDHQPFVGA